MLNFFKKQKHVDGEVAHIELLDTAGQEEFSCMTEMWLRGADGYLIVFSVTSKLSFEEVKHYIDRIERTKDDSPRNIPITVFGNKIDLLNEREVLKDDALSIANANGVTYLEGSAKERINIEESFDGIVRTIKKMRGTASKTDDLKKIKRAKCTIL